jgi:hypothetical protein
MDSTPTRINIDTYAARSSLGMGHLNMGDFYREEAGRGWELTRDGVAKIVENGNSLGRGSSPVEIAVQNHRAGFNIQVAVEFLPKQRADISWQPGSLDVELQQDQIHIDWEHLQAERLIFNPGRIEVVVDQYPSVEIEFVGDPIYVPPSANPNYVPIINVFA